MKPTKLIFPVLFLIIAACPPQNRPVLFGYNGEWYKSIKVKEDPIVAKITGLMRFYGWMDVLHIEVALEGLDTSKIVFFDSTIVISGRIVSTTNYFNDKVIFESETFRNFRIDIYKREHGIDVVIRATFENHKDYREMTKEEFFAYLDLINARLRIENIFAEPKIIEVKVDKKLMAKKLRRLVPSLRDDG